MKLYEAPRARCPGDHWGKASTMGGLFCLIEAGDRECSPPDWNPLAHPQPPPRRLLRGRPGCRLFFEVRQYARRLTEPRLLLFVLLQPFLLAQFFFVILLCVRHLDRLMRFRYSCLRLRVWVILYLMERKICKLMGYKFLYHCKLNQALRARACGVHTPGVHAFIPVPPR